MIVHLRAIGWCLDQRYRVQAARLRKLKATVDAAKAQLDAERREAQTALDETRAAFTKAEKACARSDLSAQFYGTLLYGGVTQDDLEGHNDNTPEA